MNFAPFNIVSRSNFVIAAAALAASAALAAGNHSGGHDESPIGEPGIAANVSRTIEVDAADTMRFTPSDVSVKKGETIRFVIKNSGKLTHEFSLGTEKELKEHYEVMKKFPNMEHDEANKITLKPGKQGEVIWRFTKPGVVNFACLHVGHYDAGMKGRVNVVTPPGMTNGEVRKIDRETGKITIKHGEIKHMEMPPMTMVFVVKDKNLLDKTVVGAKILFMAVNENGQMTVTDIQAPK